MNLPLLFPLRRREQLSHGQGVPSRGPKCADDFIVTNYWEYINKVKVYIFTKCKLPTENLEKFIDISKTNDGNQFTSQCLSASLASAVYKVYFNVAVTEWL